MELKEAEVVQGPMQDSVASLNWEPFQQPSLSSAMSSIRWGKLCQVASSLRDGMPCTPLPKRNAGLNNLITILEFNDRTRWVARIPLHLGKGALSEQNSTRLRSEVHTMQLIHERCGPRLPVPRIFAYETDAHNEVGVPFILMEMLQADTAMDSAGGYSVHRGIIPREHRLAFHRSVARLHVHLTSLRFPKIGTITKRADGFDVGPIPGLGGPFDTASAYLEAWSKKVSFGKTRDEIIQMMPDSPPGLALQVADAVENFPTQLEALVTSRLSLACEKGPFPLAHADFLHSNILVDLDFEAVGVIDWEGAQTVPWECVTWPRFLEAMPQVFDSPSDYGEDGLPLDEETRELWAERERYVGLVRAEEQMAVVEGGVCDEMLSLSLSNDKIQALAYAMTAYSDIGKLGFYDKIIEQLQS